MDFGKVSNRPSLRERALALFLLGDRNGDPVADGRQRIVSQALETVTDVDQHGGGRLALHGEVMPSSGLVLNLKPSDRVLEKKRHGAEVGVFGDAVDAPTPEVFDIDRWVVVQSELAHIWEAKVHDFERRAFMVECQLQSSKNIHVGFMTKLVERLHEGPEAR